MRRDGFTLLEMTVSIAILTIVLAILFGLATNLAASAKVQDTKVVVTDQSRAAMMVMAREVRQAATNSINWGNLPGSTLTYRSATDADGNGYAVDVNVDLELSVLRTLGRDLNDANNDGLTATQLVRTAGSTVRVITNDLVLDEDVNANGVLDPGEDANANGTLDRGLWFERAGWGIRMTIQTQRRSDVQGPLMMSTMVETIVPRN